MFHGFKGEAGEIGRTLTKNSKGQFIPIEEVCSEDSLIREIGSCLKINNLNREKVIYLYNKREPNAIKVIRKFIREISCLIYNTSMCFDTRAIYIGSPLMEIGGEIFNEIVKEVHQLNRNVSKREIKLVLLKNSDQATLLGACSLITHKVTGLIDYSLQFEIDKDSMSFN